jgi:hypothetical protein
MAGLDAALAGARRWIDTNLLTDTVRVVRPSLAAPVLNTTTGALEYPAAAVIYEGPGAVQSSNLQSQFGAAPNAGQPWVVDTQSPYRMLTPLDAPIAAKDDLVTVTAVHSEDNVALIGRTWNAVDPGRSGTVEVVRITPIDQHSAPRGTP